MYLPQIGTMATPDNSSPYVQKSRSNSGRALEITLLGTYTCNCFGMSLAILVACLYFGKDIPQSIFDVAVVVHKEPTFKYFAFETSGFSKHLLMVDLDRTCFDWFEILDISFKNLVFKFTSGILYFKDVFGAIENTSPNALIPHYKLALAIQLIIFEQTDIAIELTLFPYVDTLLLLSFAETTLKNISVWKFFSTVGAMGEVVQPSALVGVHSINKSSISILFVLADSPNIVFIWRRGKQTFG